MADKKKEGREPWSKKLPDGTKLGMYADRGGVQVNITIGEYTGIRIAPSGIDLYKDNYPLYIKLVLAVAEAAHFEQVPLNFSFSAPVTSASLAPVAETIGYMIGLYASGQSVDAIKSIIEREGCPKPEIGHPFRKMFDQTLEAMKR